MKIQPGSYPPISSYPPYPPSIGSLFWTNCQPKPPLIERGSHLHDLVVLHVELEVAADSAVGTDGAGHALTRLVPGAVLPSVMLALEHERARRADPDAVPAVDARGFVEPAVELGRDARVEAPAGDG